MSDNTKLGLAFGGFALTAMFAPIVLLAAGTVAGVAALTSPIWSSDFGWPREKKDESK